MHVELHFSGDVHLLICFSLQVLHDFKFQGFKVDGDVVEKHDRDFLF